MTYSSNSIGSNAFLRDKRNNEYTEESLYLALLLHCSGTDRDAGEKEVAEMLDDVNIKADKQRKKK